VSPSVRRVAFALGAGLIAAFAVRSVDTAVVTLEPGARTWTRNVGGATPTGRVFERAVVRLPGLRRSEAGQIRIRVGGARTVFRVGVDRGPLQILRANRDGEAVITLPAQATPGTLVDLLPGKGDPPLTVRKITVQTASAPLWPALLAWVVTAVATDVMGSWAFGLALASFLGLAASGSLSSWWLPLGLLAVSVILGGRRRRYWESVGLAAALVFGLWVRVYFLASAGSWDTEYWKAWMARAVDHETARVYGDADAVPDGEFLDQLRGKTELWRTTYQGREFVVDYPPLAMTLWRWSWFAVRAVAPGMERGEAENAAVKLPPVLGDVGAVLLLLWIFRRKRRRGLVLAALYWALPISWLSSGVLGFLDGAYAPFAVAGLVAAAARRPAWSGVLLAVAALIKPQALILAPAAAAALVRDGSSMKRAWVFGFGTVVVALVPFALAGTLDEAVVHVFRILFQERLSAGFANPWWLIGRFVSDAAYAPVDALGFPAKPVALGTFALVAAFILWRKRDVLVAGGGLMFAYAMLALGVHHNHPHVMFLAFAATGLSSRIRSWLVGMLGASYVLNMLCLSGLGRFYGSRYLAIEPLASWALELRWALGFDLTLALAFVNAVLFVVFLASRD